MPSNGWTVISVLAMLGTAALLALGTAGVLLGLLRGNGVLLRRSLQVSGLLLGGYAVALAGVSLSSREQILPPGAEKYFCELDCHLAYSVVGAAPVRTGEGGNTTWVVQLRTRFDERTVGAGRPAGAPLSPNPRRLLLVGSDGRWYPESLEPGAALGLASTPLTQALVPGASYTTALAFVLPPGVQPASLEVGEALFLNRLLIGHEQSFLHRAVLLAIG